MSESAAEACARPPTRCGARVCHLPKWPFSSSLHHVLQVLGEGRTSGARGSGCPCGGGALAAAQTGPGTVGAVCRSCGFWTPCTMSYKFWEKGARRERGDPAVPAAEARWPPPRQVLGPWVPFAEVAVFGLPATCLKKEKGKRRGYGDRALPGGRDALAAAERLAAPSSSFRPSMGTRGCGRPGGRVVLAPAKSGPSRGSRTVLQKFFKEAIFKLSVTRLTILEREGEMSVHGDRDLPCGGVALAAAELEAAPCIFSPSIFRLPAPRLDPKFRKIRKHPARAPPPDGNGRRVRQAGRPDSVRRPGGPSGPSSAFWHVAIFGLPAPCLRAGTIYKG